MPKTTAYEFMLFFICFNISVWIVDGLITSGAIGLPQSYQPYSMSFGFDVANWNFFTNPTAVLSLGAVSTLGLIGLIGVLTGHSFLGFGFVTLAVLSVFVGPIQLIVTGLPAMLLMFGVPSVITTPLIGLFGFVWAIFILEFAGQRDVT